MYINLYTCIHTIQSGEVTVHHPFTAEWKQHRHRITTGGESIATEVSESFVWKKAAQTVPMEPVTCH